MTLPKMSVIDTQLPSNTKIRGYTVEQMLAWGKACADAEREACEMAVENIARKYQQAYEVSAENVADACAYAIRARGNTRGDLHHCVRPTGHGLRLLGDEMSKHVHHDMIVEWAKDTSRPLEMLIHEPYFAGLSWMLVKCPQWSPKEKYRFKSTRGCDD